MAVKKFENRCTFTKVMTTIQTQCAYKLNGQKELPQHRTHYCAL